MRQELDTVGDVIVRGSSIGFNWTLIQHETRRVLARSERAYPCSWEASTAGHNAEREMAHRMRDMAKKSDQMAFLAAIANALGLRTKRASI